MCGYRRRTAARDIAAVTGSAAPVLGPGAPPRVAPGSLVCAGKARRPCCGGGRCPRRHVLNPTLAVEVGCPLVHQVPPPLEQVRPPVGGLDGCSCSRVPAPARHTSRGASEHSAAQSRKLERKPCGTAPIPRSRTSFEIAISLSGPRRAEGNTTPEPSESVTRLLEHRQRPLGQRNPVLPGRLHPLGGNAPFPSR